MHLQNKTIFLFLCFVLIVQSVFAEKAEGSETHRMDFEIKIYTPSLFGIVCGNNPYLELREDSNSAGSCFNLEIETRGSLLSFGKFTLGYSVCFGSYIEINKNPDDLFSFDISLGAGLNYNLFDSDNFLLKGICVYLYPMYDFPVFSRGYALNLKWKTAFDVGYNFILLDCISVYPYVRNIFGFNSNDFRYGFDCGIALGFYFRQ